MDLITLLLTVLDRYGLPIFTLIALGILFAKGTLRFGSDVDRVIAGLQDQLTTERASSKVQLDYVEARRLEERTGREEAEERLESNNNTLREATKGFTDANRIMQALMEARRD